MKRTVLICICFIISAYLVAQSKENMIEIHNFDFLVGKWSIQNKRLKERLVNSNEWIEFPAEMETEKILNGLGVVDEFKTDINGEEFVGLSIRLFDPKSNNWTIYWADTASPERYLTEQVVGKFQNGIGEFFGKEKFNGKEIPLRFIWKKESEDTAQWEQAYYDERNKEWETNWIMVFTKVK